MDLISNTRAENMELCIVDELRCAVCNNVVTKKCARCKKIRYCCEECQRIHWKFHKTLCDQSMEKHNYIQKFYLIENTELLYCIGKKFCQVSTIDIEECFGSVITVNPKNPIPSFIYLRNKSYTVIHLTDADLCQQYITKSHTPNLPFNPDKHYIIVLMYFDIIVVRCYKKKTIVHWFSQVI